MNEIKLWKPENLNIDKIIEENQQDFQDKKLRKPMLLFICDALLRSRASNSKKMEDKNTKFAPLWSKMLDGVVHNYNKHLTFLITHGVLITDNHFTEGKSRGYCFAYPYDGQPLTKFLINDYKLSKAMKRERIKYEKEKAANVRGYKYLTKWWESGKLDIDTTSANEWIDEYSAQKISKIRLDKSITTPEIEINNVVNKAQDHKTLIRYIKEKKYNYKFSGEGHRFYNNISNLKKELRGFLTYDGQRLSEVDMKNCQPFLGIRLFDLNFWKPKPGFEEKSLIFIDKEIDKKVRSNKDKYNCIITLLNTNESEYSKCFQVNEYIDLVLNGTFYEYFQEHFKDLYPNRFDERKKAKIEVLRIYYSNRNRHHLEYYKPCLTFRCHFPKAYNIFSNIEVINKTTQKSENYLPIILQRIESFLIIDLVCKAISESHPEILLITLHDSILTTKGNESIVEEIMTREIYNWIGYKPTVEAKDLIPLKIAA